MASGTAKTLESPLQVSGFGHKSEQFPVRSGGMKERYFTEHKDAELTRKCSDDGHILREVAREMCTLCFGKRHSLLNCPQVRCRYCYKTGHLQTSCPNFETKCQMCKKKGHDGDGCPLMS